MKPATATIDRQTRMAAVVFADLVGFSKKSVPAQLAVKEALTGLLQRLVMPYPAASRVVLDTGDGAAVGFLVSPEYALGLALRLRRELDAAPDDSLLQSQDLRLGINLGPLKVVTDVNGHPNLVGEGINSAERIMSFADPGHTTASRSFQEAVYYLDASFQSLFEPLGMRTDKHGREHEVFRLTASAPAIDAALQSLGVAGRGSAAAASSKPGLRGLSALSRPVRIGLVAGIVAIVAGTASWLAWPARQVARDAPATTTTAPREVVTPVTTPVTASPAPAAAPASAPAPAESAGLSRDSEQAPRPAAAGPAQGSTGAAQGSPAAAAESTGPTTGGSGPVEGSTAPADRRGPADAPAAKRASPPAAPPKSVRAASPAPAAPQVSPRATEAAPVAESPRTSPRCSRLLQRAAVGETLTPDEQRELVSSCR